MTKVAWFTVIRPSSHLIWVNFCCFSYFCCRLTFFVWCRFKMADPIFVWLRTLRTSPYHVVDSLHAMKFPNSAPLFSPVHWIGILEHSKALRGECTKWLVKKSLPQIFCFRSLFLTFFHFELLIFCWLFFLVSNRQKFYCCLFPRDKNVFKVNAHWVIFHK